MAAIRVEAGEHARHGCPVRVPWQGPAPAALRVRRRVLPVQPDGGDLVFLLPALAEGEVLALQADGEAPDVGGVAIEAGEGALVITLDGWEVTRYRFGDVPARPYFWPVLAPGNIPLTRAWPMSEEVATETRDHPHHRSMYFAFGSVNGVDNWSEEPGHGRTVHRSIDEIVSGPVFGRFRATSDWTDCGGKRLLQEQATVTVWNTAPVPSARREAANGPPIEQQDLGEASPLSAEQIAEALEIRRQTGEELADILLSHGWLSERDISKAFAQEMGLPFVDLSRATPDPEAIALVPEHVARRHTVLPLKRDPATNSLYVAMADLNNPYAADDLRLAARCTIKPVVAAEKEIAAAIDRAYGASAEGGAKPFRLMDVELRLTATDGDVLFGDTKEGGLLTVRVATSMDAERGGRIENSFGGIGERECWGRAAHWCDYSGQALGKQVGIAVMDHPDSFRYPTYWHVRDYGLMAANPFALGDYTGGAKDGSYLLPAGETLLFRYRVVLHEGNASEAEIRGRYLDFVAPPVARVEDDDEDEDD